MTTCSSRLDHALLAKWAQREVKSLSEGDTAATFWSHSEGKGFGITIVAAGTGEFHLLADGTVTSHVEKNGKVTLSDSTRVRSHAQFEERYNAFRKESLAYTGSMGVGSAGT